MKAVAWKRWCVAIGLLALMGASGWWCVRTFRRAATMVKASSRLLWKPVLEWAKPRSPFTPFASFGNSSVNYIAYVDERPPWRLLRKSETGWRMLKYGEQADDGSDDLFVFGGDWTDGWGTITPMTSVYEDQFTVYVQGATVTLPPEDARAGWEAVLADARAKGQSETVELVARHLSGRDRVRVRWAGVWMEAQFYGSACIAIGAAAGFWKIARAARRWGAQACASCGYPRAAGVGAVCSECGVVWTAQDMK